KQRRRNREVERLRRLEIEHQIKFRRLLDRQIAGLGALENLVDEQPLSTEHVVIAGGVSHQPSRPHVLVVGVNGQLQRISQRGVLAAAGPPLHRKGRGRRASSSRARNYNGLIATLRNLTTPSPNCSANGPSVCRPLRTLAVCLPSNMMERSRPLAIISMVLHLPPALGIGLTSA